MQQQIRTNVVFACNMNQLGEEVEPRYPRILYLAAMALASANVLARSLNLYVRVCCKLKGKRASFKPILLPVESSISHGV